MKPKFILLIACFLIIGTNSFAQSNNSAIYIAGAQFLLSKTNIDPTVIKIVENALPKAMNQDVEGTIYEFTKVIYEKKNIKELNPDFALYLTNKVEGLVKSIKRQDYFEITMAISDVILVTDNYISKNTVPDKSFLNTNKVANSLVDTTAINKSIQPVSINQDELLTKLRAINAEKQKISCLAFTPFGGYVIIYGRDGFYSQSIPSNAYQSLHELNQANKEIKSISFTPSGGYLILYGNKGYIAHGISELVLKRLDELNSNSMFQEINKVVFTPFGGCVIVYDKYNYEALYTPVSLNEKLRDIKSKHYPIENVSFDSDGGFVVNYGSNGFTQHEVSQTLINDLTELHNDRRTIDFVSFITGGGYVVVYDNNGFKHR